MNCQMNSHEMLQYQSMLRKLEKEFSSGTKIKAKKLLQKIHCALEYKAPPPPPRIVKKKAHVKKPVKTRVKKTVKTVKSVEKKTTVVVITIE